MSIKAYAWAKSIKTGSPTLKAVLCAIADYADDKGRAWPSLDRVSDDTEFSARAVRMAVSELADVGLIIRQPRFRPDGGRSTDVLVLQTHLSAPLERGATPLAADATPLAGDAAPLASGARASSRRCYPRTTSELPENPSPSEKKPADKPRAFAWPSDFEDQFWAAYPRHTDRKKAMAALAKVHRQDKTDFAAILAGCQRLSTAGPEKAFLPHATTWLNGERWNDELPTAPARIAPFPRQERTSAITAFADRLEARHARNQQQDQRPDHGSVIEHEADGRSNGQVRQSAGGQAGRFSPETALRFAGSRWG